MGQDFSSTEIQFQENNKEDNDNVPLEMCSRCFFKTANYRGKLMLDDMSDVYNYKEYLEYWCPGFRKQGPKYVITYTSCNDCMKPELKDKFTHIEDGWKKELFVEDDYEILKI